MILVAARVLFGVEIRGSYLHLLVAVLLYLFGALGFGLFISTLADTQALAFQAGLIASMLPAILLSGFIFQIRIMPERLQLITYLVPARYFLVILRGIILKGEGLAHLLAAGRGARRSTDSSSSRSARRASRGGRPEPCACSWRVIVKEFLQLKQDRKMIPVIFVAPVVQVLVFGFAVNTDVTQRADGAGGPGPERRPAATSSRASCAPAYFELVGAEARADDVDRWLVTGRAQMALVIPRGFGDALAAAASARLQIVADGTDASSASVALGYAGALVQGLGRRDPGAATTRARRARPRPRDRFGCCRACSTTPTCAAAGSTCRRCWR